MDAVALVRGWSINWSAIYLFLFVFSSLMLINIYWDEIKRWKRANNNKKEHIWDFTLENAINYIAFSSYYSDTLRGDMNKNLVTAISTFQEQASNGKIFAVGRKPGKGTPTPIKTNIWRKRKIGWAPERGRFGTESVETAAIMGADGEAPLYEGIMVDKRDLYRLWPPKPDRF